MEMMRSQPGINEIPRERGGWNITFRLVVWLAVVVAVSSAAREVRSQTIRQVPAPLPKLVLNGRPNAIKQGATSRKIALTITNWEKYSAEMFQVPAGQSLPPSPCSQTSARIVISIYSERGDLLAACVAAPAPVNLGRLTVGIQKGMPVPEFVYAVVSDRITGAAYRSNLVSPSSGATK